MMKSKKVWFWVGLTLFALPELLWSPVLNFYYEFYQSSVTANTTPLRLSWLYDANNHGFLELLVILQFIGVVIALVAWSASRIDKVRPPIYYFVLTLLVALTILIGFCAYFLLFFKLDIL